MPKALFFLLLLTIFSFAALWFVENDGNVVIEWMGYRAQTSVAFAILFLIITIVTCTMFMQMILWIKSTPKRYRQAAKNRKLSRGLTALSQGFAAIAAGDSKQAHSLMRKASNNLENAPLTKLLAAQTAQMEGNHALAKQHYTAMLEDKNKNKETEIIAIKGLLLESKQDGDLAKALFLAEKAYALRPDAEWVILILLDLYRKMHKWTQAEKITLIAQKRKLLTKSDAAHILGLLAFAIYETMPKAAKNSASEKMLVKAYKLVPEYVPIITAYANLLISKGKTGKAANILENQWRKCPHPDIANEYMTIYERDTDEKRLARAHHLLELYSAHPEGHALVARTALACGQLGKARQHLKIALSHGETREICLLMAELETMERANHEVVHYWRERAMLANEFSVWQCKNCHSTANKWHITCNNCHAFDSIEWRPIQMAVNVMQPEKLLGNG